MRVPDAHAAHAPHDGVPTTYDEEKVGHHGIFNLDHEVNGRDMQSGTKKVEALQSVGLHSLLIALTCTV